MDRLLRRPVRCCTASRNLAPAGRSLPSNFPQICRMPMRCTRWQGNPNFRNPIVIAMWTAKLSRSVFRVLCPIPLITPPQLSGVGRSRQPTGGKPAFFGDQNEFVWSQSGMGQPGLAYIFSRLRGARVPIARSLGAARPADLRASLVLDDGCGFFCVRGNQKALPAPFASAARLKIGASSPTSECVFEFFCITDFLPMYERNDGHRADRSVQSHNPLLFDAAGCLEALERSGSLDNPQLTNMTIVCTLVKLGVGQRYATHPWDIMYMRYVAIAGYSAKEVESASRGF